MGNPNQMQIPKTGFVLLNDQMLVNIGENYLQINLQSDEHSDVVNSTLQLKLFNGTNFGETYEFNVNKMEANKRDIFIGRGPNCDLRINDSLLSKIQCHIRLKQKQKKVFQWYLHDGFNEKKSTNGTWLYINHDLKVYHSMEFKANQTIFRASLVQDAMMN